MSKSWAFVLSLLLSSGCRAGTPQAARPSPAPTPSPPMSPASPAASAGEEEPLPPSCVEWYGVMDRRRDAARAEGKNSGANNPEYREAYTREKIRRVGYEQVEADCANSLKLVRGQWEDGESEATPEPKATVDPDGDGRS